MQHSTRLSSAADSAVPFLSPFRAARRPEDPLCAAAAPVESRTLFSRRAPGVSVERLLVWVGSPRGRVRSLSLLRAGAGLLGSAVAVLRCGVKPALYVAVRRTVVRFNSRTGLGSF